MTAPKNLPASVAARLLNRARQASDDYQTVLTSYCLERFLQVRAFARRAGLSVPDHPADKLVERLGAFLLPVIEDVGIGERREGTWPPGGPWTTLQETSDDRCKLRQHQDPSLRDTAFTDCAVPFVIRTRAYCTREIHRRAVCGKPARTV